MQQIFCQNESLIHLKGSPCQKCSIKTQQMSKKAIVSLHKHKPKKRYCMQNLWLLKLIEAILLVSQS